MCTWALAAAVAGRQQPGYRDGNVTFDEFLVALDIEVPDALKYDSSSVLRGTQTRPTADERRRSTGPKGKTAEDIEASYADSCAC